MRILQPCVHFLESSTPTRTTPYPIAGPWANLTGLSLEPEQKSPTASAETYFADEHAFAAYGLRLIKGRNFQTSEMVLGSTDEDPKVGSIIITEDLSRSLFPSGDALGKTVFMRNHPRTIVGIIADMKVPEKGTSNHAYKAVFMPVRLADVAGDPYIVRTQPGAAERVRESLADTLYKTSRLRILDRQEGIQNFRTLRSKAFATDRGLVILLFAASIILLLATAGGIIGITTLWVDGRRRALGLRRALGARRRDILGLILAENFFIVLLGILSGSIIALIANISLMHYLALKACLQRTSLLPACLSWYWVNAQRYLRPDAQPAFRLLKRCASSQTETLTPPRHRRGLQW